MGKRNDTMACGCRRIEGATLDEASLWLTSQIEGMANVEVSIVVGGDRCSFYRAKKNPRGVLKLESKGRGYND